MHSWSYQLKYNFRRETGFYSEQPRRQFFFVWKKDVVLQN